MSDFPKGGSVEDTRAWLDKEGFMNMFNNWKADALLGTSHDYIKSRFPTTEEGQEQAEMLWGFLNTAKQSTGDFCNAGLILILSLGKELNVFRLFKCICVVW